MALIYRGKIAEPTPYPVRGWAMLSVLDTSGGPVRYSDAGDVLGPRLDYGTAWSYVQGELWVRPATGSSAEIEVASVNSPAMVHQWGPYFQKTWKPGSLTGPKFTVPSDTPMKVETVSTGQTGCHFVADAENEGPVWVGGFLNPDKDRATPRDHGIPIYPGESIYLEGNGTLYAIGDHETAQPYKLYALKEECALTWG